MRSSTWRRRSLAVATVTLVALVSACGSGGSDAGSDDSAGGDGERVSLTVAPASPSFVSQAYYYLADHLGFFEEENLDVEIISQFEGGQPEVALLEGKLDVVAGSPTTFFERMQQDPDSEFRCVAVNGLWPFRIMVPADSDIDSPEDLKGQDVGVPEVSDVATLEYMLSTVGMSGSDVNPLPVGGRAPAAVEMEKGTVVAFMGTHVDQLAIEGTGFEVRELETVEQSSTFNTCMLVTATMLEENPDAIEGFLRALAKGFAVQNEDPELAVALLGEARTEAYDSEEQALALMEVTNGVNGGTYDAKWEYAEEDWQLMVEAFADAGALESSFEIAPFLDFSLLGDVWDFDVDQVLEQARDGA
jgi:ABC-type nitrate/sulfonate/bicarbonate transport system substrate-binding protein